MGGLVMRRREFVSVIVGAAAAWPLAARAQQSSVSVVGLLTGQNPDSREFNAIRKGLEELGYSEGRNVAIIHRSANGHYDRLPELAADLARRHVAVIVAVYGTMSAVAAKNATTAIPIVFVTGGDPVELGLVGSLNRPGGNLTGVSFLINALGGKRLQLLRDLVPTASVIGILTNPNNPYFSSSTRDLQDAARTLGLQIRVESASNERDIEAAFTNFLQPRIDALIIEADAVFTFRREQIVALATRYAVPTLYFLREFVTVGGLISYGASFTDALRLAGAYAGRILKGEKPAYLPVQQSTRLELVINLKTVKALSLNLPPLLLAIADEVIE
jgi:putative ABC transport system substrate-binding protein